MRIVLGVSGGIAAYKAVTLARRLLQRGHALRVVPTQAALRFVGAPTWEAVSGHAVHTGVFDLPDAVEHVRLGKEADLVIVAPATADLLARAAAGRADDLLTSTLLVATCPVVMAPAMHTEMWRHPATAHNVQTLRDRGVRVIDPATGRLTGPDSGVGRLPEPDEIVAWLESSGLLGGAPADAREHGPSPRRMVVTAGGTREPIDPVRFLGNRSTGRQGVAIAAAAARDGWDVTLVGANLEVPAPSSVLTVPVETADELLDAVRTHARDADALVMAAAVADYRVATPAGRKLKKTDDGAGLHLDLVQNPDILATVVREGLVRGPVVGFAAETASGEELLELGRAKVRRKGCDLLAVNQVGGGLGFAADENRVLLLDRDGGLLAELSGSKDEVARGLVARISAAAPRS